MGEDNNDLSAEMLPLSYLEDGKLIDGDSEAPHAFPVDFDMDKFHRGRHFFRDNVFSCSITMFFSLIIGMSIPEFLEALVFTGETNSPQKAMERYLMTHKHILYWHYGNIMEFGSTAYNSIKTVRAMHAHVRSKMCKVIAFPKVVKDAKICWY